MPFPSLLWARAHARQLAGEFLIVFTFFDNFVLCNRSGMLRLLRWYRIRFRFLLGWTSLHDVIGRSNWRRYPVLMSTM